MHLLHWKNECPNHSSAKTWTLCHENNTHGTPRFLWSQMALRISSVQSGYSGNTVWFVEHTSLKPHKLHSTMSGSVIFSHAHCGFFFVESGGWFVNTQAHELTHNILAQCVELQNWIESISEYIRGSHMSYLRYYNTRFLFFK